MEIILSQQCESLTGSLGRGFGYFIVKRKERFYSVRSKHTVPPDGHLKFILACANLAQNKLHIVDVKVPREELSDALWDAGREQISNNIFSKKFPEIFSAADINDFKNKYKL